MLSKGSPLAFVAVWVALSLFVQTTDAPLPIVMTSGWNEKSEMATSELVPTDWLPSLDWDGEVGVGAVVSTVEVSEVFDAQPMVPKLSATMPATAKVRGRVKFIRTLRFSQRCVKRRVALYALAGCSRARTNLSLLISVFDV